MDDDPRIQRIAQRLVDKHDDKALAIAKERVHDRLATQDYASAVIWARVVESVHILIPDAGPKRARDVIGASLDKLRQWRPPLLLRLKVAEPPRKATGREAISPATLPRPAQRKFVLRKRSAQPPL
jgi:hypothetical protein